MTASILAAVSSTGYNIVLLLHILTALIAFAPAFTHPLLRSQLRPDGASQPMFAAMILNTRRFYSPALIVTGLLGFAVAGMSDKVHQVSEGWLIAAVLIWVAMNGVLHALIVPGLKTLSENGASSGAALVRVQRGSAIMTGMLVVQLWLMIWQPGG